VSGRISNRHLLSSSSSSSASSALESSGAMEMVSMSEYTYEGFISTNAEIDDVTLEDLKSGIMVITMFAVFYGLGFLGLFDLAIGSWCSSGKAVKPAADQQGVVAVVASLTRKAQIISLIVSDTATLESKKEYLLR
jgi:hypothetical protein